MPADFSPLNIYVKKKKKKKKDSMSFDKLTGCDNKLIFI